MKVWTKTDQLLSTFNGYMPYPVLKEEVYFGPFSEVSAVKAPFDVHVVH